MFLPPFVGLRTSAQPTALSEEKSLPPEAKDHALKGDWLDFREFHISGDLLVIYQIENDVIKLVRIGSHNQLFNG